MKRNLLVFTFALAVMSVQAQTPSALKDNSRMKHQLEEITPYSSAVAANPQRPTSHVRGGGLTYQAIGTAGNLYTILDGNANAIAVNNDLNTVVFIHRNDQTVNGGNVGQYRYDVSTDGGTTWMIDYGTMTPSADNGDPGLNGRFPQTALYNPMGNTNPDSAYMVYAGTWHNGGSGSWEGTLHGVARLDGDSSTFTENQTTVNSGNVTVASGLTEGEHGVYWNVVDDNILTFANNTSESAGIIVMRGEWNDTLQDVVWTERMVPVNYIVDGANSVQTALDIAFDPTGQMGWISLIGDLGPDQDNTYDPIFLRTTDGGITWSAPMTIDLDSIDGVYKGLATEDFQGNPVQGVATTAFDAKLAVDVNGNPHMGVVVGVGDGAYAISATEKTFYDINWDASRPDGCKWLAYDLSSVFGLRGEFSTNQPAATEDNRPQAAVSEDGTKIFFSWLDSDFNLTGGTNDLPNFHAIGIDVVNMTKTDVVNFTEGDQTWDGNALFATTGNHPLVNGSTYNIPTIFTEVDYQSGAPFSGGSDINPAAFYYIQDISFDESDFTNGLDDAAPNLTVIGAMDTVIELGSNYNDAGATAFDCFDGDLTSSIAVSSNVDANAVGTYEVTYVVTDAAGNEATETRTVTVLTAPTADFSFSNVSGGNFDFTDASTNNPDSWQWNFGDNSGSQIRNPSHEYVDNGTFTVSLTVSNQFGSDNTQKDVTVSSVGINDPEFARTINVYPNPTQGVVNVKFANRVPADATIFLHNLVGGETVRIENFKSNGSSIQIDLSAQAIGVYFLKIESEGQTAIKKLTIN